MRQFLKFMFASMLGTFFMLLIAAAFFFAMISALISSVELDKKETISNNSVLYIDFKHPIPDRSSGNPFENINFETFESEVVLGLNEIIQCLEKAKNDDKIKGIYLNPYFVDAGFATIEELRDALMDFKESGKFIYCYGEVFTQTSYYIASTADEIHMNPTGYFDLKGLSAQLLFFKGTMEKLEIEPQVIRHGKFKSAVEPFVLDKMSDENRLQTRKFVNSIWDHLVMGVASKRNLTVEDINSLADDIKVTSAEEALKYGFIDKISYQDEVMDMLKEKLETDESPKLVKMSQYLNTAKTNNKSGSYKNKIAVIYASGEIISGKSSKESMGSETIAKAIEKARKDENVKAIVLRVNSPGGSALASEVIWREMTLAKKEKPTIVSMGNLAASGGYYISCAADKILASENTITGSIGVFGLIPNMKGLFNNKLGITIDTVKTNSHSDINTVFRPLSAQEKAIIQGLVERIYADFVRHVAEGRNMSESKVDSIGQGRVWSGSDALKLGLIDEFGGLNRAIEVAAEMAEISDNYQVKDYPEQDNTFQMLMRGLSDEAEEAMLNDKFNGNYQYYQQLEHFIRQRGLFTRMPFDYVIE